MKFSKITAALLCFALLFAFSACSPSAGPADTQVPSASANPSAQPSPSHSVRPTQTHPDPTMPPAGQTLYQAKDVEITFYSMIKSAEYPQIAVGIENNSSAGKTVRLKSLSVNGLDVPADFSSDVQAGEKKEDVIPLPGPKLEEYLITDIYMIELSFDITGTGETDSAKGSAWVTLFFDDGGEEQGATAKIRQGKIFYYDKEILVMYRSVSMDDPEGPKINVYIENNSANSITVEVRDFTVNAAMIDPVFSSRVAPGETKDSFMLFTNKDFESNGITEIEGMEFSLEVYDTASGDLIILTDPLVLNLK